MKINLFRIASKLEKYLKEHDIKFNSDGYPIFPKEVFLTDVPNEIVPFNKKQYCKNKSKTVICFFSNDLEIYRRLNSIDQDIPIYKEYLGIVGFDLSPRTGWDDSKQKFNILLSQMATLYIALHGVKIIPNFRIGDLNTILALNSYPKHSIFAVGILGCSNRHINTNYLLIKLLFTLPSKLYLYGSVLLKDYKNILDEYNIEYNAFLDFNSKSRQRSFKEVA